MLVDLDVAHDILTKPAGIGIEELSEKIGLNVSAIRRAVREGWLPYTKPGKAYLFNVEEVRAAIDRRIREQPKHKR